MGTSQSANIHLPSPSQKGSLSVEEAIAGPRSVDGQQGTMGILLVTKQ